MQTALFLQISVAFMALLECSKTVVALRKLEWAEEPPPVGSDKYDFKKGAKGSIGCCCYCGYLWTLLNLKAVEHFAYSGWLEIA